MIPYPLLTSPGSPSGSPSAGSASSPSGGGGGPVGLLIDLLTVKPTSAVSTFRKLRQAYAGAFLTAAGSQVTGLLDQSGNSRDYAQATAANKPALELFGSALAPAVRLDSNAKFLQGAVLSSLMSASTGTIVALAYVDLSNTTAPAGTANTGSGVIADGAEGGALWAGYNTGALKFGAQGFDGGYKDTANIDLLHDRPAVMIWQHGSGTLTVLDGFGNSQTVAMGDITYGAFHILIGTSDSKTMVGRVFEVLTFDQVLGAGDLALIKASMNAWVASLIVDVSGFPSAANTGTTGALATQTGDITLSTPGQVYQNNNLTGKITVNANNVTIQNCKVLANGDYVIIISDGITGTIVQDCEIYSTNVVAGITALHGDGTFRRNNIHNVENGITVSTNAVITDNYIHDLAGAVDSHFDCIECNGLQTSVVISHNTLLNPTTQTSAININDGFGASSNILVDNNYCAGGAYTIYVAGASADLTGITVTNNVLEKGAIGYLNIVNATPVEGGNRNYWTGHMVGNPVQLPAFAFQAETVALQASRTTASAPMSLRQQKAFDRLIVRLKGAGISMANVKRLYVPNATTEALSRVNLISPGTGDMTIVSNAPTYTANDGWSGFDTTHAYDTGLALQTLGQGAWTILYYSKTATAAAGADFGATTAGGDGITANCLDATNHCVARLQSTAYTSTSTTAWPGIGMYSFSRSGLDTFGVLRETPTTTYVAPATSPTIHLGKNNGSAVISVRKCGAFAAFDVQLTAAQRREASAALLDYCDKVQYGMVDLYEAAVAPTTADYDIVVYGGSWTALCAAIAAKDEGKTVAIVLDWQAKTDWDIGGMVTAGLSFADYQNSGGPQGIFRDAASWINTAYYSKADVNDQQGNSPESRAWQQAVRRLLDPARTGGTIPGRDIPVYLSGGIKSVASAGLKDTAIITNDGRTFTAKVFIAADYDGEYLPAAGLPYIIGSEVVGTGTEISNGYLGGNAVSKPYASAGTFNVDPYLIAGNSGSGLLPDMAGTLPLPGLTVGGVDPALEAMNYRLAMTDDVPRGCPVSQVDPVRNYNALRYEAAARLYVLKTDVTIATGNLDTLMKRQIGGFTKRYDVNSGMGGLSTDLGSSGDNYAKAGTIAARRAVIDDLRDYTLGYFHWHVSSGDSRIPSTLVTQFGNLGLDATSFLDPGTGGVLFFPNRSYCRDPVYQLQNTGYVGNGNDYSATDGGTPRSVKTVATVMYFDDKHFSRRVNFGNTYQMQGSIGLGVTAGVDKVAPIPLEEIVPDVATKTNVIVPWAASVTKIAWYMRRLEPTGGLCGEAAGIIASLAIDGSVEVQNITYSAFRTKMLARDTSHPVLPIIT